MDSGQYVPPLFVALDANQSVVSQSSNALQRLQSRADTLTLTYSYRATRELVAKSLAVVRYLHSAYHGKDFKESHYISSGRDHETAHYVAALGGPEVTVETVQQNRLVIRCSEHIAALSEVYEDGDQAIVVVGSRQNVETARVLKELRAALGPGTFEPHEIKGREFFAGLVIDLLPHTTFVRDNGSISEASYKWLSNLYVGLTRFRDRVVCLVVDPASPLTQAMP